MFAWKEGQFDNALPSINLAKCCKTLENLKELHCFSLPFSKQIIYSYMPEKLLSRSFGIEIM